MVGFSRFPGALFAELFLIPCADPRKDDHTRQGDEGEPKNVNAPVPGNDPGGKERAD